ncbi:C45 family peptidase [Flavobacterium sp. NKUCC04_CG]|uniref:C45 family autoproteolytic acyltransferase/hydolase n=1 Tax=Flavobacterium sp. NKUCC04_CG TaxID=2842121 RepID=UPI001C5AB17D|nr:C45 family peptidase [Flavobacterium sp. NKUCC04_CG]MBW3518413.1 C45 family peptidase [Flavobacterium sp. NKUCC04_CG]
MKNIKIFLGLLLLLLSTSCMVKKGWSDTPDFGTFDSIRPQLIKINDSTATVGTNFIIKNRQQLWELYTTGDPLQIGYKTGVLTQDLYHFQEEVFFSKVEELIPSPWKQRMLVKLLKYYNRDILSYIPLEYQLEIYGVSEYASDQHDFLGKKYERNIYLHGAHDIGHAFQDLALVGCSSLAVWDDKSADGSMLIGRNFDFYAGDDFAKNKIISFVKPEKGHAFMSVTWAGMTGVVSGMNAEGLTVTINAAKSSIPLKAKTPISILAREILQYATTIDEAIAIAKDKKVFVSESIMVGSAADRQVVLLEISPKKFDVYRVENNNYILCSNHFQSEAYQSDKRNLDQIEQSHSAYRWDKMNQLIDESDKLNPEKMAAILREKDGLHGRQLGYGNEKALNQLLAHHAVIFKPEQRLVWVSSNPYQLGEFVAYDLNKIFGEDLKTAQTLGIDSLIIAKDPFLETVDYENYEKYRQIDREIQQKISDKSVISAEEITAYQQLNPELWSVYFWAGKYYYQKGYFKEAQIEFEKAKTKEITTDLERKTVEKYLRKTQRRCR